MNPALRPRATTAVDPPDGRRRVDGHGLVALGAVAAVLAMAVTSSGDVLVLGVLVGLAAADVAVGACGVMAGIATVGRWGSSSLAAVAGAQAVVGPAGWSGPPGMVVSSWAAAAAVVVSCPRGRAPAVASGLMAAALVAGPAVGEGGSAASVALRVAASLAGVAAAAFAGTRLPEGLGRKAGMALAALAIVVSFWP